jgi:nucleoside-diphosphate-sugar epimerase
VFGINFDKAQSSMKECHILVTGSNGFVGRSLSAKIISRGWAMQGATRTPCDLRINAKSIVVGVIDGNTDWFTAVKCCNTVIHLAARAHVMHESAVDPIDEYRKTNVEGTLNLARQAGAAGVRRFVFISSIKVNGESTREGQSFFSGDSPAPLDPYGVSKMEAEQGLREIASRTGMEVVIIRPPLVYGPGVKANFQAMMRWLSKGVPLPLGAVNNKRSLVALDNLVDLIVTCIDHPAAANQTFLVSDGEDLSTTELLRRMGQAMGKPARLMPVPPALLKAGAAMVGKPELAQRLCGSLQVDISKTRELLGWNPPISVDEGLRRAAEGFRREASV